MIRDPIMVGSALEPAVQAVAPKEPAERKTAWITVSVLIGAGVIAATQIGKGIISLPTLQDEFGLSYGRLSLVVSMFALLGATVGSLAGIAVQRFTPRRTAPDDAVIKDCSVAPSRSIASTIFDWASSACLSAS